MKNPESYEEDARDVIVRAQRIALIAGFGVVRPVHIAAAAIEVLDPPHPGGPLQFTEGAHKALDDLDDGKPVTAERLLQAVRRR